MYAQTKEPCGCELGSARRQGADEDHDPKAKIRLGPKSSRVQVEEKDIARFWSKVDRRGPDECWEWTDHRKRNGYGEMTLYGGTIRTHRLAWQLAHGPILGGLFVCHRCDNPPCCNPDHLFLGTTTDNIRDASKKGRMPIGPRNGRYTHPESTAKGERHGMSKLKADDILRIREDFENLGSALLAERYGVTPMAIRDVMIGRTWKHI